MTAFQILEMKHFMAKLLTEDCFDSFLLEKASVSCAVSYEIDGRVNPEFYQDDETPDAGYLFLPWKSIRPVLFQMIRGKHTPLSFKFVLHLMPQYVPGVMKGADPSLKPEQVQALVLTIKYDGSAIRLTTGTAFSSFVPDKTLDAQWDKTMRQFLSRKEIACRESSFYFFILGLKIRLARYPKISAAAVPAAPA